MVLIGEMDKSNTFLFLCSGFLIDRTHVVSSAHCFETVEPKTFVVRISTDKWMEGDEYSISKIAVPESYRSGYFYDDIAILTLSREVDTPDFVPICLPDETFTRINFTGWELTQVGWSTVNNRQDSPDLLVLRDFIVVSNEACNEIYRRITSSFRKLFPQGISTTMMCAGSSKDTGICVTSGGPLMFQDKNRWYAVGIVNFGSGCGRGGIPDMFTKVSSHLDWIRKNTRD